VEVADRLCARGFSAEALNGDIAQAQREKTVDRLKSGRIDLLVATDVAARGLDVQRVSHVINYDIPYDTESYVHRIGRTGRAGRAGEAVLFVAPRERRMLKAIEKATGQAIEPMQMPSVQDINESRVARFKQRIIDGLAGDRDLGLFYRIVREIEDEQDADPLQIASVVAAMLQGDVPLLLEGKAEKKAGTRSGESDVRKEKSASKREAREPEGQRLRKEKPARASRKPSAEDLESAAKPLKDHPDVEMERFRVEVGYTHGVKPGNIVGAIANEADLESRYIGHIEIFDDFSLVDLPAGMPKETFRILKKVWVCQRQLQISRLGDDPSAPPAERKQGGRPKRAKPHKPAKGKGGGKKPKG
jgi:ATP-dependent RNA helicase DeaD